MEAVDSKAKGLTRKVISLVEDENNPAFTSYFKEEMAALSTDLASNMVGQYNSLATNLEAYLREGNPGRILQKYHCSNHRLSLAYNDVMYSNDVNLKYCKDIIHNLNKLANFYSTKAYRRRHEMLDKAKEEEVSIRRYKSIQKVRWMSATQESYKIFDGNFRVMSSHFASIQAASFVEYTAETRTESGRLLTFFTDRNVLATMYHHLDIITTLSIWSKHMEHKVSNIMDIRDSQEKVDLELQALLAVPGMYLSQLYKESRCDGVECNERTFTTAKKVIFRGAELNTEVTGTGFPPFSQTRQYIINFMLEAIDRRFPKTAVSAFSVLNPESLPSVTDPQAKALGDYLVRFHSFQTSISQKLFTFLKHLGTSEFYEASFTNQHPVKFWELALISYPAIKADKDLLRAIHISLVQPASTAR